MAILKPRLERLETLLAAIEGGQRGSRELEQRERRIQAECRQTHKLVGRALEALFTLAGEETLARSLRSEARRRARRPGRRKAATVTRTALKPALSILEWLRDLFGRVRTLTGPVADRISGITEFFRWQRGSERPETLLPALARRS